MLIYFDSWNIQLQYEITVILKQEYVYVNI